MNRNSIWSNERKEIATWLSGYLAMVKKWVDKILNNEDHDVDKIKIIAVAEAQKEVCAEYTKATTGLVTASAGKIVT